jgi:hypothetical protein
MKNMCQQTHVKLMVITKSCFSYELVSYVKNILTFMFHSYDISMIIYSARFTLRTVFIRSYMIVHKFLKDSWLMHLCKTCKCSKSIGKKLPSLPILLIMLKKKQKQQQ